MILGAVLAGGRSTRFGSDKALALLGGESLITRAIALLRRQCSAVVVVGREEAPAPCIADWPAPDMGPLAGLASALRYARDHGFSHVLSVAVDALGLDDRLLGALIPAPAYVESQPVIGLWPIEAVAAIESILAGSGRHSLLAFAEATAARAVTLACPPANINSPADLAALMEPHHGL